MFEKGTKEILNQNIPLSLELLKSCEISLEETVNKGLNADADLILATLHNIALCYQHLNNLEDCAAYLEACIYNIKSKNNPFKSNSSKLKSEKIRRLRYLCLLHIQLCDCLHKLKNYQPAYRNAEKAVKCSVFAVKLCINACFDTKNSKHQTQIAVYSSSKHPNFSNLYNETCGILQFLFLLMNGKKLKKNSEENYKKTIFYLQKQSD